ncbi:MAG: hypothetical protein JWQ35_2019 [Bacteriovoracaceae bacterium]|nr:hypothetical protein [Bacteriovoracaceae bacterium]
MTKARVHPIECFKGGDSKDFDVIWPGGVFESVDKEGKTVSTKTFVPGTPNLKVDQTAVLYLYRTTPSEPFVVHSWINGVMNLEWDAAEKQYVIQSQQASHEPTLPANGGHFKAQTNTLSSAKTLKSFGEKVKQVLSTQKK